ncbi:glycosyltransferase [Acinetobacter sp. ANC 4636]
MKKKLIFIIDSLESGGAEKSLVTLLNMLDYNRFEVDLGLVSVSGLYLSLVPKHVNIFQISKKNENYYDKLLYSVLIRVNKFFLKKHAAQTYWKIFGCNYLALNKKYDVAIAYTQGFPTYYCATYIKSKKKIAWVNTNYDLAGYSPKFDLYFYDQYDNICLVSNEAKEVFVKKHPMFFSKLLVIKDIISEKFVKNLSIANPYPEKSDDFKILTIGRLVPSKGYDLLIAAAKKLDSQGFSFHWYIIGEGHLYQNIKNDISILGLQHKITLLGTFENVYPYINHCDLYCQTSRFEGFGMAIAEARILSKPIVVTNFNTATEQIINGENGLIVDFDGEKIASAISKLILDQRLISKMILSHENYPADTSYELNKFNKIVN